MAEEYDLIIVGGGPAGLTAAIYSTRYEMNALLLGKEMGGALTGAPSVENYPGIPGLSGYELMKKIEDHARSLGVRIKNETAAEVKKGFVVKTESAEYRAKSVIMATGMVRRKLGAPGEDKFLGKGVGYCATCDAPLFRDAVVGVVGGSDSAAKEALLLSQYAKKVYILYRKEEIRAEPATKRQVDESPNIEIIPNVNVVEIYGDSMMKGIMLDNGKRMEMEGVFIAIGGIPASGMAKALGAQTDAKGNIIVNDRAETGVPGLFAAGDVTTRWEQGIVAAGDGAVAANSAYNYVKSLEGK